MRRSIGILCLAGLLAFGSVAMAAEPDARSFAMGGAYVAVVQDATAIYWNPAGLADVKLLSLQAGFGAGTGNLSSLQDMMTAYEAVANQTLPSTPVNFTTDVQGGVGLNVAVLNLGAGYNSDLYGTVSVNTTSNPVTMKTHSELREDLSIGGGIKPAKLPLGLADLKVGAAVKQVKTTVADYDYTTDTLTGGTPDTQYAVDLGVKAGIAKTVTVGLVAKDIGLSQTHLTLGAAITPPLLGTTVAVDVEDSGTMHFGIEQSLLMLDLRAGVVKAPGEDADYRVGLGLDLFGVRGSLGVGKQGADGVTVRGDVSFTF